MASKHRGFRWLGSPSWEQVTTKRKKRILQHYRSFQNEDLLISVNDDVLIRNSNEVNPESLKCCYIGRVDALFEYDGDSSSSNEDDNDRHRAIISWYSRAEELPARQARQYKRYFKFRGIPELFRNVQPFETDIDAETIFGKCKISHVSVDCTEIAGLSRYEAEGIEMPQFFVRLVYDGKCLAPIACPKSPAGKYVGLRSQPPMKNDSGPRRVSQHHDMGATTRDGNTRISDDESSASDVSEEIPLQYPLPAKTPTDTGCALQSPTNGRVVGDSKQPTTSPFKNFYQRCQATTDKLVIRKLDFQSPKKVTPIKIVNQQGYEKVLRITPAVDSATSPNPRRSPRLKSGDASQKSSKSDRVKRNLLGEVRKVHTSLGEAKNAPSLCSKTLPSPSSAKSSQRSSTKVVNSSVRKREANSDNRGSTHSAVKNRRRWVVESESDDDTESSSSSDVYEESDSQCSTDGSVEDVSVKRPRKASSNRAKATLRTKSRTPVLPKRESGRRSPVDALEEIRQRLHVAAIPDCLPCRESQFSEIYAFVEGKLVGGTGGCMYISGVPGTGKTATVHEVIRALNEGRDSGIIPAFKFVSINGMKLTEPRQAYVQIYKSLTCDVVTATHAADLLEKRLSSTNGRRERVVLLVDELDLLWTGKQDVMYSLFDWPNKPRSQLVVLAIANTMDLPERVMKNRVSSRVGLTRLTFHPYNFKQLQTILMARMKHSDVFHSDAVQLVARKVAALSGDARRALDICRRATELAARLPRTPTKSKASLVGMQEVDRALQEMFSLPKIQSVKHASDKERVFLQAVMSEFQRVGLEEATFSSVFTQLCALCRMDGMEVPNYSQAMYICYQLGSCRLLLLEHGAKDIQLRIRLNISIDDLSYALKQVGSNEKRPFVCTK